MQQQKNWELSGLGYVIIIIIVSIIIMIIIINWLLVVHPVQ